MTALWVRLTGVVVVLAVSAALLIAYLVNFLLAGPSAVASPGTTTTAHLTVQTVASMGAGPHPDWVSYWIKDAHGNWQHSTVFKLPAHALVTVTVLQYDTATGLRNPFFGKPRGTVGGVFQLDGKTLDQLDPDLASHTFAVPDLGISVPLAGVADDAKNQCSLAPCTLAEAHRTITFQIRTGKPGHYRWQCFVPCGAGTILGFGGPMQTIGYMDGSLDVV